MVVRPLRIVVTLGDLRDNGGMRSTAELVRRWNASGMSACLFALQPSFTERAGDTRGVSTALATSAARRLRFVLPVVMTRLWAASRRADVVASGSETGVGLVLTFFCARFARRPFAVFIRSDPDLTVTDYLPGYWRPFARLALRRADALICTSLALAPAATAMRRRSGGVHVVRNGLHSQQVRALASAQPAQFPGSGLATVASAGRLSRQKGYDVLLEAHARLLAEGCLHRVLILGDGPEREALVRRAARLGVSATFQLPGQVDNPYPDIAAADVFCLPSRYEGLSRITLEVLALGVPVIATTAVREALDDGTFGELVAPDDPDALVTAIRRHLANPARLRALASSGPSYVRRFDWGKSADACIEVFDTLVSHRRGLVFDPRSVTLRSHRPASRGTRRSRQASGVAGE